MVEFPEIRFSGQLRNSQAEVAKIAARKLAAGERRLHVVAPPGSGKTILGLYLWAHLVKQPAIVLSPNSAIQAQWAARTSLFQTANKQALSQQWVTTDSQQPTLLTSLTYQSITLPQRANSDWQQQAIELWKESLIAKQQAQDWSEAEAWLEDLQRQNQEYYQQRLAIYTKQVRDGLAADGRNLEMLHQSSLNALHKAKEAGIQLLILDECHHLVGHWGRVLHEAVQLLDNPVVIGLTATPPDTANKSTDDVQRYQQLLGEIIYEVPVPAVVKDGFLAPYQDLVQFVRPTAEELDFISNVDRQFQQLLQQACQVDQDQDAQTGKPHAKEAAVDSMVSENNELTETSTPRSLIQWVQWTLKHKILPQGKQDSWQAFEKRDPTFAETSRQFLLALGLGLPPEVPTLTLPGELLPIQQRNRELLRLQATTNHSKPTTGNVSAGQGGPTQQILAKLIHDLPLSLTTPILDRYIRHRLRRSSEAVDQELAESFMRRLRILGVQITETGFQACASPVSRVLAYSQNKVNAMVNILQTEDDSLGPNTRAVVITDYERTSAVESEIASLLDEHAGGAVAAFRAILKNEKTNLLDPVLLTGSTILVDQDLNQQLTAAANRWLQDRNLKVELRSNHHGDYVQLLGSGSDWCVRVYVQMITELFQSGITRCLVGTRGLLGEGWDASRTNVLVDLTTVTTSMSVNQLRGRSIRLDKQWAEKVANNWDVVCVAPEFAKGFDDFDRFKQKHATLFGVADDGQVEKGAGHVHAIFNELQPEQLESTIRPLNEEMIQRSRQRTEARSVWKIGQPFQGQLSHSLELRQRANNLQPNQQQFSTLGWPPQLWNTQSLTALLGQVVLESLQAAGAISQGTLKQGNRQHDTVRLFLENATPEDARLVAQCISQLLGPIDDARYIIPRKLTLRQSNWLSRWFPDWIGGWMESKQTSVVWHQVPTVLAANKQQVAFFESAWNRLVSPGQAIYVHRGAGRQQLQTAIDTRATPDFSISQTEIFH